MERLKNWGRKIRDRNAQKNQFQDGEDYEKVRKLNEDLKSVMRQKKTIVKQVIDQSLEKIDVDRNVKLEAQFERDYPGRKAIWKGKTTGLFKQWLKSKDLFNEYFIKDKDNFELRGRGTLTVS